MAEPLMPEHLEALRRYDTPTVANAIETFNIRPRNIGFMDASVRCMYPDFGVMVGYACTAIIAAAQPAAAKPRVSREEWWNIVARTPAPRVVVMQDIDTKPIGSFWGEVNGNIHKALGCAGVVTNGGVRDMNEVRALGFHYYASAILVSHAYIHLVDIDVPVTIGGIVVNPGDIIHADQHGVQVVPAEIVPQIPEAVARLTERERVVIEACQAPDFSIEKLKKAYEYV